MDLFSGIGGFALAVDRVWPGSEHIFCDNDLFCQEVLKKHWPNSKIYGDIRTITNAESEQDKGLQQPRIQPNTGTILTGGFPCQPFSQAGRRKGTADDRYLWPEMFRVIRDFKPTWVIAENVRGLLTWNEGLVLEQVCADMESEGYEVQPLIIPAVSKNAPHRRDRVWIVANSNTGRIRRHERTSIEEGPATRSSGTGDDANTKGTGWNEGNGQGVDTEGWQMGERGQERDEIWIDSGTGGERSTWSENWLEVATRLCRVDDGLPRRMDRNPRLKALGNAIVPQVVEEIMKAIKQFS